VGRLLAVDLGAKRVGLALSDPQQRLASPLATLAFKGERKLLAELLTLIREKEVEAVILGLPLREDGSEGRGCQLARGLAGKLEGRGVPTVLWDERYSSREAEALLKEGGLKRRRAIDKIDRVAASLILEDYLSSLA